MASPGPSRRPCSSMSMTHSSTGTWEKTAAPLMAWRLAGHPFPPPQVICHQQSSMGQPPGHAVHTNFITLVGMVLSLGVLIHPCSPILAPVYIRHELVPVIVSIGFGSINFSHRPDETFLVGN